MIWEQPFQEEVSTLPNRIPTDFQQNSISEFFKTVKPGIRSNPSRVHPQNQKELGSPWNPIIDCYLIKTKLFRKFKLKEYITQRKILRFVATIFDPLSFTALLTIRQLKFSKAAWNLGLKWDKPLLVQNFSNFVILREDIPNFEDIQILRSYIIDKPFRSVQLHVSEFGLSIVFYIRVECSDQSIAVSFVIGKVRVARLKKWLFQI